MYVISPIPVSSLFCQVSNNSLYNLSLVFILFWHFFSEKKKPFLKSPQFLSGLTRKFSKISSSFYILSCTTQFIFFAQLPENNLEYNMVYFRMDKQQSPTLYTGEYLQSPGKK